MDVVVVRVIYLEKEEEEIDLAIGQDADVTLKTFCQWQQTINPKDVRNPNHHDIAVLLTRWPGFGRARTQFHEQFFQVRHMFRQLGQLRFDGVGLRRHGVHPRPALRHQRGRRVDPSHSGCPRNGPRVSVNSACTVVGNVSVEYCWCECVKTWFLSNKFDGDLNLKQVPGVRVWNANFSPKNTLN